ncbi:hypothetical protein ACSAZK_17515 [Methanosarcina sp. Mfa9]|uniref:hypothetical protein n=1 Tax=Methanosarcina sp. Mfa9 TaxID=3439063 RepID=UPI003F82EA3D
MADSIPKHLLEKISIIYAKKGCSEFRFQEVVDILGYNNRYTGQIMSELVSSGWIIKKRDESDKRIKIYKIKDPSTIFEELGNDLIANKE